MASWVLLLRGINVGGHRKLPMAELTGMLCNLGYSQVRHHIQSGNLVFCADAPDARAIGGAIEAARGFRPEMLLIEGDAFLRLAQANPFAEGRDDPKTLHLFFLASSPAPDAQMRLTETAGPRERFVLTDTVMYLHTLDRLSGSQIAQKAERLLGVAATARNWNTVAKICAMVEAM